MYCSTCFGFCEEPMAIKFTSYPTPPLRKVHPKFATTHEVKTQSDNQ